MIIVVVGFVSIILHNLISGLIGSEEVIFFIFVVFVIPVYVLIALIMTILALFNKKKRKR